MSKEEKLNRNKVQSYQQLKFFAQEEKDIRKTKPAKEDARKNPSTVQNVQERTRQKTSREERKKARGKGLRWIKALNAELDEVIKQSGESSEDILLEILGEALYDPAHQKLPFKQAVKKTVKKNIGPAPIMKKGTTLKAQEEFVPKQESQSQREQSPQVKVTFFPEKDNLILNLVKNGANSPVADLYLHRQALSLLFSPGFEVLLSVKTARNIQLLDYQLNTVHHVLKYLRGRALLCDEVGLGKTIEAGLILMEYLLRGLVRRVLVLTPPSLVEQWRLEMQTKFNLNFVPYDAPLFKTTPHPWANFPYIIASLDTAKREPHRDMVLEQVYDLVIVDEAHHLKKQKTQAYQLVSQLKKKYMLLLTATPVENDLEELFNLITLLQPGQLETASSFKRKYITKGDPLKPKNVEELKKLVREVMVRNRRSETGVITAKRHAEVVEVALSPEEAAFYQRLTSFVRGHYTQETGKISGAVNQFVLKTLQREVGSSIEAVLPTLEKMALGENHPLSLRHVFHGLAEQAKRVSCRAKAEVLVSLLKKIPAKAVVFTCFVETMHFLAALLEKEGFRVARLAGGMQRAEKEAQVLAFADKAQVLVSTETGSEGRNLQFCNVIVNFDLPWNPMRIEQRIGRLHRLGQTRDVYIYNLSAAETVEAHILELLDTKINMFQLVVGELDLILGNLQEKRGFEDIIMDIWARATDEASLHARLEDLGARLSASKKQYLAVKEIDERLLGELLPAKD